MKKALLSLAIISFLWGVAWAGTVTLEDTLNDDYSLTTADMENLPTVVDNSIADTLHRHSELVASDGSPDPALSADASGNIIIPLELWMKPTTGMIKWFDASNNGLAIRQDSNDLKIAKYVGNVYGADFVTIDYTDGSVGINDTTPSYQLEVNGTAHVTGVFTAGTKTFVIDHPLQPTEKILTHAVFEGPEHGLIYRGVATLVNGRATVDIDSISGMTPGTFNALAQSAVVQSLQNQDSFFRVKPGPIVGGTFTIECEDSVSDRVAWMVMAERKDPLVKHSDQNDKDGHLIVETDKETPTMDELKALDSVEVETEDVGLDKTSTSERVDSLKRKKGYYLNPEAYGTTRPTRTVDYKLKTLEATVQK